MKGVAEEVDGVALEAEPYVGVEGGGDADVGVAEEFLDHDEFHPPAPGGGAPPSDGDCGTGCSGACPGGAGR